MSRVNNQQCDNANKNCHQKNLVNAGIVIITDKTRRIDNANL